MHRGYTLRWRKRWDKGYHKDPLMFCMMEYMIDHAAWEDTEKFVNGIGMVKLKRGECIITIRGLADFFGVGPRQIRTRLESMKNIGFSTQQTTQQTTQRASIYFVTNYDTYQKLNAASDTANDTQTDTRPTHRQNHPYIKNLNNNKNIEKKKKKTATEIPENFLLTEKMRSYGMEKGMSDIDMEFEHFVNHHEKKGDKFVSWEAAWRTWCINHKKFKANGNGGKQKNLFNTGDSQLDANLSAGQLWLEREMAKDE